VSEEKWVNEVKWIKISTNIFDDEKIKLIDGLPETDSILVIWFKLLTLAGKVNENGSIYIIDKIPVTEDMLVQIFNREKKIISLALKTLSKFGMIEINNHIEIVNWNKYQNVDGLEKIKEQNRKRVEKYRRKKKSNVTCNVTETLCNGIEVEVEKEIEKEKERGKKNKTSKPSQSPSPSSKYGFIKDLFNDICINLTKIKKLTSKREKTLNIWINQERKENKDLDLDDYFREFFIKVKRSDFLNGNNKRQWKATFDWIIKPDNRQKILEGNYKSLEDHNREVLLQAMKKIEEEKE